MYAQFYPCFGALGDAEQFNPIAEFFSINDVLCRQLADAFNRSRLKVDRHTKCQRTHQGDFVRCVHTLNVKSWVGFGVAQFLRNFERIGKCPAFVAHLCEDEIGRAVDNSCNPLDAVGRQPFAQSFNHGNSTCNRRLKRHGHTFVLRRFKNFVTVYSEQGFVRGHHVLAIGDGFQYKRACRLIPTHEFNHDIDIGMACQRG